MLDIYDDLEEDLYWEVVFTQQQTASTLQDKEVLVNRRTS